MCTCICVNIYIYECTCSNICVCANDSSSGCICGYSQMQRWRHRMGVSFVSESLRGDLGSHTWPTNIIGALIIRIGFGAP